MTYKGIDVGDLVQAALKDHDTSSYDVRDSDDVQVSYKANKFVVSGTCLASTKWHNKSDIEDWFDKIKFTYSAEWSKAKLLEIAKLLELDDVFFVITFQAGKDGLPKRIRHFTFLTRDVEGVGGIWNKIKRVWKRTSHYVDFEQVLGHSMRKKVIARKRSKVKSRSRAR